MAAKARDLTLPIDHTKKNVIASYIRDNKEHASIASGFYAEQQSTPDKTIAIYAGIAYFGTTKVEYDGLAVVDLGTSGAFEVSALTTDYYNKVLFTIDSSGTLAATEGTENAVLASVVEPAVPAWKYPVCMVSVQDDGTGTAGTILTIEQSEIQQLQAVNSIVNVASHKNAIINGSFTVCQRATSAALTTSLDYGGPDKWLAKMTGTAEGTISQIAGESGHQYMGKLQRTAASTELGELIMVNPITTADSIPLQGKDVTISFYAKAGANFSAALSAIAVIIRTGTGSDEAASSMVGGWTGTDAPVNEAIIITTTKTRYSVTGTIASGATQIGVEFHWTPTGTAGADDSIKITGVKLEEGSVATDDVQELLSVTKAKCEKFYFKLFPGVASTLLGTGYSIGTTTQAVNVTFPTTMFKAPTALEQNGTATDYTVKEGSTNTVCSSVPLFSRGTVYGAVVIFTVAAGLTVGLAGEGRTSAATTAGYLAWSADI